MNVQSISASHKAKSVFPALASQQEISGVELPAEHNPKEAAVTANDFGQENSRIAQSVHATTLSIKNFHAFGELFANYLRARHEVFVVQKGWALPETDGFEFDQYDTPQARWIVIYEYGQILAGARIAPTTARCGKHSYMLRDAQLGLLDEIPADVLYSDAPVGEHVWEATRLFLTSAVSSKMRLPIQAVLMNEMAAAARQESATHLIGIVPAVFKRWLRRIGMTATGLGPVLVIDRDRVQAALMNVVDFQT